MTQEEKNLLNKDFGGRILDDVKFHYTKNPASVVDQDIDDTACGCYYGLVVGYHDDYCIERCKPYLRPMSSMTDEERDDFYHNRTFYDGHMWESEGADVDWLNAHHFDYRGLIEKGLALEAPENMYNLK